MSFSATAGAKFYISPTSVVPDTINALNEAAQKTLYEAINDWIEVEEVEDLGTVGDAAESIPFTSVGDARVRKIKGARDAGTQSVEVGRDPIADGQAAMVTAEKTDFNYPFKIEFDDAPSSGYSDSIYYYAGLVMTRPTNLGAQNNVTRQSYDIGINTSVLEVLAGSPSAPANTLLPSISGIAQDTEVLTAVEGVWNNNPTAYTYQWQKDDAGNGTYADIGSATSKTYTVVTADVGDSIRVQVTAVNGTGSSEVASVGTSLVAA